MTKQMQPDRKKVILEFLGSCMMVKNQGYQDEYFYCKFSDEEVAFQLNAQPQPTIRNGDAITQSQVRKVRVEKWGNSRWPDAPHIPKVVAPPPPPPAPAPEPAPTLPKTTVVGTRTDLDEIKTMVIAIGLDVAEIKAKVFGGYNTKLDQIGGAVNRLLLAAGGVKVAQTDGAPKVS